MNTTTNIWFELAAEMDNDVVLHAAMDPHIDLILGRAAEGAPGTVSDWLQTEILAAADEPATTPVERLTALLSGHLRRQMRIATGNTIVLTETLTG